MGASGGGFPALLPGRQPGEQVFPAARFQNRFSRQEAKAERDEPFETHGPREPAVVGPELGQLAGAVGKIVVRLRGQRVGALGVVFGRAAVHAE